MSRLFGPIRQVAYVVRDAQAAMDYWTRVMEVGPFFYFETTPDQYSIYRGQPFRGRNIIALSQSGAVQIEIIQPLDEVESPFTEFLKSGRDGVQHVAFWTEHYDADMARYLAAGYKVLMSARAGGPDTRLAYLERDAHSGPMIEISEVSGPKGAFFRRIAETAATWDGTDPIRKVTSFS